ncbi:conjugal transfer protein TrbL family protein [Pseudonocardia sp. CA-107938]|uniref:conjugal transfer protein TrbL family protein n=1 Tax=Pseudonocardia sp. CA-107938 TaxID=3240021 RepID=UPI003D89BDF6
MRVRFVGSVLTGAALLVALLVTLLVGPVATAASAAEPGPTPTSGAPAGMVEAATIAGEATDGYAALAQARRPGQPPPSPTPPPTAPVAPNPDTPAPAPAPGGGAGAESSWLGDLVDSAVTGLFRTVVNAALNPLLDLIGGTLLHTPTPADLPPVADLWNGTWLIAMSLFGLLVMAAGVLVMGYETVQTHTTIREVAPRLVLAFIVASQSLWLIGQATDLANGLSAALLGPIDPATGGDRLRTAILDDQTGGLWLILMSAAVAIMLVIILVTFVIRLAIVAALTVMAPLALVCYALPVTSGAARWWWRALCAVLAVQIAQSLTMAVMLRVFLTPYGFSLFGDGAGTGWTNVLLVLAMLLIMLKIPMMALSVVQSSSGGSVTRTALRTYFAVKSLGMLRSGAAGGRPGGRRGRGGSGGGTGGGGGSGGRPGPTGGPGGPSGGGGGGGLAGRRGRRPNPGPGRDPNRRRPVAGRRTRGGGGTGPGRPRGHADPSGGAPGTTSGTGSGGHDEAPGSTRSGMPSRRRPGMVPHPSPVPSPAPARRTPGQAGPPSSRHIERGGLVLIRGGADGPAPGAAADARPLRRSTPGGEFGPGAPRARGGARIGSVPPLAPARPVRAPRVAGRLHPAPAPQSSGVAARSRTRSARPVRPLRMTRPSRSFSPGASRGSSRKR